MATEEPKNLLALLRVIAYLVITLMIVINIILLDWFFSAERVRNRCLEPMQGAESGIATHIYGLCYQEYPKLFTLKD